MDRYEIILYWSAEDAAFIAEVPELPGCMAHGDTQDEALHQAQEAMAEQEPLPLPVVPELPEPQVEPEAQYTAEGLSVHRVMLSLSRRAVLFLQQPL